MKNIRISVKVTYLSAEKLSEQIPPQIQFQMQLSYPSGQLTNVNGVLTAPFVFTLSTVPPLATISLKGKVRIEGDKDKVRSIEEKIKSKQPPPFVLQAIMQYVILETIILAREIGIPPPIPVPVPLPQKKAGRHEIRYGPV
ncbi:MAG: hypothetical protein DRJ64_07840 [Thermoprotei archaeon]|nr:MAG: hypothetical protein B6U94_03245 [Thermofilum sp. ex4484_79]RLF03832.1 MAG: hypothetical protein DRJ64_07840 [Thermoprotei archaeon]